MKMYNKYKASNTKWVDEIPFEWKIVNFRYLIDVLTDFTANGSFGDLAKNVTYLDSGFSRLIRQTDLNGKFKNKAIYVDELAHNYLSKSELFGGEVILANVGSAGLSWIFDGYDGKATLGPNCFLLKFNQLFNNKFAYISLNSYYLNSQILDKASSSIQPKLNKEDIRTCKVIVPSIQEQIKITEYIDYKTNLIDTSIEKKKRLIELLKEKRQAVINEAVTKGLNPNAPKKDSGVEWLGDIPEHWKVKKLKHVVSCNDDTLNDKTDKDLEINYIEIGDVSLEKGVENYTKIKFSEAPSRARRIVKENDIILSTVRTYLKAITKVNSNYDNFIASTGFVVLRSKFINPDFLGAIVKTENFIDEIISLSVGVSYPAINSSILLDISIPLPPENEQLSISDKIDKEFISFQNIISKIEIAIEKLQTYRQSLISEAVTGKIDVRDWQPTKN